MAKERSQNPVIEDELNLRLFTYNSNQRQNVQEIESVQIFKLDETFITEDNPEGRVLVAEFLTGSVEEVSDPLGGHYKISFILESELYTIGNYLDVWNVRFSANQSGTVTNAFTVLADLWYAADMPIVYDFSYGFRPNRIKKGEKRWLTIDVIPNVPRASDLEKYYTNLALSSPITISIEKSCGNCVPKEKDLRIVVEDQDIDYRRDSEGYYFLDTDTLNMDCGIYNVWFKLNFGENTFISDNIQLQVY